MQLTKSERDKKFWSLMLDWFKEQPTRRRHNGPLRRKYKPVRALPRTRKDKPVSPPRAKKDKPAPALPPTEDVWDWPDE